MKMQTPRLVGALLLALSLAGLRATSAHAAATLTVSTCDESHLTVAVSQANSDNAGDTINFGCSGTINLTDTLVISGSMFINGNGNNVVLDGGGSIQLIKSFVTLGLDSLTLSNGSSNFGAAIWNSGGTLNASNVNFSNNTATSGFGGAVFNSGMAHISGSTFSGNAAQNGGNGGAIENYGGQLILTSSNFNNNSAGQSGGGISNEGGGTVSISNGSTFSGNSATASSGGSGGAIYNNGGTVSVADTTLSGNTASSLGGAISESGTLVVTRAVFSGNSAAVSGGEGGALDSEGGTTQVSLTTFTNNSAQVGGAIRTAGSANVQINATSLSSNSSGSASPAITGDGGAIENGATTTISSSTLSANTANGSGGAIHNLSGGTVNLENSTVSNNHGAGSGGAVFTFGTVHVTNSTLAGNSIPHAGFGGALLTSGGAVTFAGSIVAGNIAGGAPGNCSAIGGSISDSGYNLEDGADCGFTGAGSLQNTNPLLASASPQDNGGPTQTFALQPTSPANDQIPTTTSLCPATDQRGYGRPDDSEGSCDVGAYESGAQPPAQTVLSQVGGSGSYGGKATLTATLEDASNHLLSGETITFVLGGVPVCDVPGEPSCPQTGASGASLGVATLSGVSLPPDLPYAITYPGDVHASFGGDIGYGSTTGRGDLAIGRAATGATANASAGTIQFGQSITVDYDVSSSYGLLGNTTTGRISIVKDTGPGNLPCSPSSTGLSANQSNADGTGVSNAGFDFVVNSASHSTLEFVCTPDAGGSYTYHVHFNDTDPNYKPSNSGSLSLTVNSLVSTSISSVSGSASYGGTATFAAALQGAGNTGLNGKTVTFSLWTGSWTPICGGSGQPACPTTQNANGEDGVATLSGVTLPDNYADAGSYAGVVQATYAGDSFDLQSENSGDLTVAKTDQTISFGSLQNKIYGDADFTVGAGASSGLSVSFGASGNCSVTGATVHLTGAGSCTVTASQGGNGNYNPAAAVLQSFNIAKGGTTTSLTSSANPSLVGQQITYTAAISPVPDGGAMTFTDAGASIGCDNRPINTTTGKATCSVTYNAAGSHSIAASYSGDANFGTSVTTDPLTQQVGYTVHLLGTRGLTIGVQLWDVHNANVSAPSIVVTARCLVPVGATAPAACPPSPIQTINKTLTFRSATKELPTLYWITLKSTGLAKKHSYFLLVQVAGDPNLHAVQFTD